MSMWNRTTGFRRIFSAQFFIRAALAAALTCFAVPWFLSQVFVLAVLQPPCLPDSPPPPGFEPVSIPTRDGLRLHGLWRRPENGAVILFMGGIGANRSAMLKEAEWMVERGFGSVLIESRSCQGRSLTLGYRESGDFIDMKDFARQQGDVEWFGAFGFSSGAAAAIRAAAQSQDIQALVVEGGYANLSGLLAPRGSPFFSVEGQLQRMNLAVFWQHLGFWPGLINPLTDLEKVAPRPVLLIYGEKELNRDQAGQMLSAAGENGQLWIAPGVGHGQYADLDSEKYKDCLLDFFMDAYSDDVK
ncbi:MAG: alpha/beta hydrolase [Anaerolineaceae bacterium]